MGKFSKKGLGRGSRDVEVLSEHKLVRIDDSTLAYKVAALLSGVFFGLIVPGILTQLKFDTSPIDLTSVASGGLETALLESVKILLILAIIWMVIFAMQIYFVAATRSFFATFGLILFLTGPLMIVLFGLLTSSPTAPQ